MSAFELENKTAPVEVGEVSPEADSLEDVPDIEKDFVSFVGRQDRVAKESSRPWRADMQSNLQMFFSEVMSATEPVELGTWYVNAVGRRIEMYADSLHERLFPDPINYANFHVLVDEPPLSLDSPEFDINKVLDNRSRARLAEMAMTSTVRRGLRDCDAQSFFKMLLLDRAIMGNCYATVDYEEVLKSPRVRMDDGMDDYELYMPLAKEIEVASCGFKPRRIDPRNLFPGSIEQDGGIECLEWWTEYDVLTYNELLRRRRVKIDGEWFGRYHNWKRLAPSSAYYVSRVYYDDLSDSIPTEPIMLPVIADPDLEKGWRICRRIGMLGLQDMRSQGFDYSKAEWVSFLERMVGAEYDTFKNCRYFDVVIAHPSNSSDASGGVLLSLEPHWYGEGMKCPRVQSRLKFHAGQFFGDGFYKTCSGDESLLNILLRSVVWQQLYSSKPAALFDDKAIDSNYLAANDGVPRLLPASLIPARMATQPGQKVFDFLMPQQGSIAEGLNAAALFTQNIDQTTRQSALNFGEVEARVTATNVAAAQANSEVPIRADATSCDTTLIMPWLAMVLGACVQLAREHGAELGIDSYSAAEDMRGLSGSVDAVLDAVGSGAVERAQAENLFPATINVPAEMFNGQFKVSAVVNSSAGGRIGYLNALQGLFDRSVALQSLVPNQTDLMGLSIEIARQGGVTKPEMWLNSQEAVDRLVALQMAQAGIAGAQAGGVAGAPGQASPPRESKTFDAGAAAMGMPSE